MKKILTLVTVAALLASCGGTKNNSYIRTSNDTVRTIAFYYLPMPNGKKEFRNTVVYRVEKDSNVLTKQSDKIFELQMMRVSDYYVPIEDTVRENGKAKLDSAGNPQIRIKYINIPPEFVKIDGKLSIDSLMKEK